MANRKLFLIQVDPTSVSAIVVNNGTTPVSILSAPLTNGFTAAQLITNLAPAKSGVWKFKVGAVADAASGAIALVLDSSVASDIISVTVTQPGGAVVNTPTIDEVHLDPLSAAKGMLTALLAAYSLAA